MVRKFVLLAFLAAPFLAAGCSTSDDTTGPGPGPGPGPTPLPAPTGCNVDTTLSCSGGSTGFACDIGSNPEDEDSTLSCSTPALASGEDDYCCYAGFTGSSTTCQPDDSLTAACPDPTSYGYTCAAGDNPVTYDATLNCSDPTPDGDSDDFCCTYGTVSTGGDDGGGTIPAGCNADDTLDCSGSGAQGFACDIGSNPEDEDSSLSCSNPALASGEDDYCCFTGFTGTSTTCEPNDDLTDACPDENSYGYTCAAGDDPKTYDSTLNCSDPTPNGDEDDFCCEY